MVQIDTGQQWTLHNILQYVAHLGVLAFLVQYK